MAAAGQRATNPAARAPGALTTHPTHQLGGAMTYTALTAQHAYTRTVARDGLPALLAPYTVRPAPAVVPAQRRRFVRTEVAA